MKALYRKYRPTKLAEVIGQPQVTDTLTNSLKTGKFSHAYLFTGPRGCGKTSVARIFAHAVNKFPYEPEDSYTDIIEIDAASNTGVDNIRELRERVAIAPTEGKYKVYIIDEVHMLSKSAFNALLKTIEEPPEHVIFIMATTDAYKVPDTIVSRSQVYNFRLVEPEIVKKHLKTIAKQEKIAITDDALDVVVNRGGGSFRDTISLLDQVASLADTEITAERLNQALGLPENQKIEYLLDAYENADLGAISDRLKDLLGTGVKPEIVSQEILTKIVKHPKPTLLPLLKTLPSVQAPFAEAKLLLAFTEQLAATPSVGHSTPDIRQSTPAVQSAPVAPQKPTTVTTAPEAPEAAETKNPPESPKTPENPPEAPETAKNSDFAWETYLENIKSSNLAIYNSLTKSAISIKNREIEVTPKKPFTKAILESPANLKVLKKHLPDGFGLRILDVDPTANPTNLQANPTKNSTLSKISDIMGADIQEVTEDATGDPF